MMAGFDPDRPMYRWRRMSPEQREAMLKFRRQHQHPWHSPPHYASDNGLYLITAACFEHRPIIGETPRRMAEFERELLEATRTFCREVFGWIILPNHYHLLVHAPDVHALLAGLGRLHGRTSYHWNGEEGRRGRKRRRASGDAIRFSITERTGIRRNGECRCSCWSSGFSLFRAA